jgi:4-amino-4-deoxy-L-arabinose transferase-like glycosyltransferase
MQTTAMTELPFMAVLVASIYCLQKWAIKQTLRWLIASAVLITLGTITRYEGWAMLPLAGITVLLASNRIGWRKLIDGGIWGLIAAVGPVYWLWHNWAIYGKPLEFYNGPYSARGIYARSNGSYDWVNVSYHSFKGSLLIASVTTILCLSLVVFILGISGYITEMVNRFVCRPTSRGRFVIDGYVREFIAKRREWSRFLPTFLLIVPFCFFIYSLYTNEIQVVPLAMIALYNVRYGLMHLIPAAIFAPAVIFLVNSKRRTIALAIVSLVVILQYGLIAHDGLLRMEIVQEPLRNNVYSPEWRNKEKLDKYLLAHPPQGKILMETGYLGTSVMRGGLQFRDVIYDGDARFYKIEHDIPPEIHTVMMKNDDSLWQKFHDDPDFNRQFSPVFTAASTSTLIVYERQNPSR